MRLALMIEGQEGVTWEQWVALAQACEEHGIDSLFRSDHYISFFAPAQEGSLDAWTTLAGLAAVTTTLRLGTLVSPVTFRHPSVLAKAAAAADHISGGRIELGLGAGWMAPEHAAYGFPFPPLRERMEMLAEQTEIIHRQWTEERFDFHGKHYVLEGCAALPKPVQSPRPPLIMGGKGKRGTAAPAARFCDEYNTFEVSPEEFADIRGLVREACERHGRDPETMRFSLMTGCVIGDERARRTYESQPDDVDFETWRARWAEVGLIGTLEEVAARIREYEEAGCERLMLQHLLHDDLEAVAEFGRDLAPAVA